MQKFHINIKKSLRKSLSLRFDRDGVLQVKAPFFVTQKQINMFLEKHKSWIEKHHEISRKKVLSETEIKNLRQEAKVYIPERVEYFAKRYDFHYEKIRISQAYTRWGSCSTRKTLSFSCRLMLYKEECIDYVIIHELCHLRHMNHSKDFWEEVKNIMPEYKKWEKELKESQKKDIL